MDTPAKPARGGEIGTDAVFAKTGRHWAEWFELFDAAGCDEIVKQYRIHVQQEKAVTEEIRRTNKDTVATNVLGAATLATIGIGFFTWDDSVDAEENLAELRVYREAIAASGRKKNCALPVE